MVQFGAIQGRDGHYYLIDDAERLARLGDVNVPSPEEMRKYSPLGAVARRVLERLGNEPLDRCLNRNLGRSSFGYGYRKHRGPSQDRDF